MGWAKGFFATLAAGCLVCWFLDLHGDALDFAAAGTIFAGFLVGFWVEQGMPLPRLRQRDRGRVRKRGMARAAEHIERES